MTTTPLEEPDPAMRQNLTDALAWVERVHALSGLGVYAITRNATPDPTITFVDIGGDDLSPEVATGDLRRDLLHALSALGRDLRRLNGDLERGQEVCVDTAALDSDGRRAAVRRVDVALARLELDPGSEPEPASVARVAWWRKVRAEQSRLFGDALAVATWLEVRHPGHGGTLRVDTARDEPLGEVAYVIITGPGDPARYKVLWREACGALAALGWAITGGRGVTNIYLPDASRLTNHARLEAYKRVERAFAR